MYKIRCPQCGRVLSQFALSCPVCNHIIREDVCKNDLYYHFTWVDYLRELSNNFIVFRLKTYGFFPRTLPPCFNLSHYDVDIFSLACKRGQDKPLTYIGIKRDDVSVRRFIIPSISNYIQLVQNIDFEYNITPLYERLLADPHIIFCKKIWADRYEVIEYGDCLRNREWIISNSPSKDAIFLLHIDIKNYYESIDLDLLQKNMPQYIEDSEHFITDLKNSCVMEGKLLAGPEINDVIGDLFMTVICEKFHSKEIPYVRSMDDIYIYCSQNFNEILGTVTEILKEFGLQLNEKKTRITAIDFDNCTKYIDSLQNKTTDKLWGKEETNSIVQTIKILAENGDTDAPRTFLNALHSFKWSEDAFLTIFDYYISLMNKHLSYISVFFGVITIYYKLYDVGFTNLQIKKVYSILEACVERQLEAETLWIIYFLSLSSRLELQHKSVDKILASDFNLVKAYIITEYSHELKGKRDIILSKDTSNWLLNYQLLFCGYISLHDFSIRTKLRDLSLFITLKEIGFSFIKPAPDFRYISSKCPVCDQEVKLGEIFCTSCGHPIVLKRTIAPFTSKSTDQLPFDKFIIANDDSAEEAQFPDDYIDESNIIIDTMFPDIEIEEKTPMEAQKEVDDLINNPDLTNFLDTYPGSLYPDRDQDKES